MSDSRSTPSTAAVSRTPSPNRLRTLGSSPSSLDVTQGMVDAFADVFAQMATMNAPANPPRHREDSATAESSDPPDSGSASAEAETTEREDATDSATAKRPTEIDP